MVQRKEKHWRADWNERSVGKKENERQAYPDAFRENRSRKARKIERNKVGVVRVHTEQEISTQKSGQEKDRWVSKERRIRKQEKNQESLEMYRHSSRWLAFEEAVQEN